MAVQTQTVKYLKDTFKKKKKKKDGTKTCAAKPFGDVWKRSFSLHRLILASQQFGHCVSACCSLQLAGQDNTCTHVCFVNADRAHLLPNIWHEQASKNWNNWVLLGFLIILKSFSAFMLSWLGCDWRLFYCSIEIVSPLPLWRCRIGLSPLNCVGLGYISGYVGSSSPTMHSLAVFYLEESSCGGNYCVFLWEVWSFGTECWAN